MSGRSRPALQDEFVSVTGQTLAVARKVLHQNRWDLERAVEYYYRNEHRYPAVKRVKQGDKAKLNQIFDQYAGEDEEDRDAMFGEKMAEFFTKIGVDPEGCGSLAVAHQLKCSGQGELTRQEFVDGFSKVGADTMDTIGEQCKKWVKQLESEQYFRTFYRWLFEYAKDDPERRVVETEAAVDLWSLVLPVYWPDGAEDWCDFVEQEKPRVITKDVWYQVLEFALDVGSEFQDYDFEGSAWPGILDKFVEHMLESSKNESEE